MSFVFTIRYYVVTCDCDLVMEYVKENGLLSVGVQFDL